MLRFYRLVVVLTALFALTVTTGYSALNEKDVRTAMEKAADFMMNTVSTHGGFVSKYTSDLSEQWGEVPARKTMIWVEDPGTVGVGNIMLDAYKTTGDKLYIEYAKRVADALIWGQYPSGGWHYFIDFDMTGVQKWYDEVASKCWGWNEYYHYYGNCTFDDRVTTGAAQYLLDLYMLTFDPAYRVPLLKAIDFILESQYPNGGWPQRYPLKYDFPHDGHDDYTSFYTFNDGVIQGNIYFLLDAWERLGNEEYKNAAYRGMDFVVISQWPKPQAGWGHQYDMEMHSAWARSYEPASLMPSDTVRCISDLEQFYMITGDRRYLRGIPDAIEWIENSILPEGHNKMNPGITHAICYELGTNKPLYAHREGTSMESGRYWVDYEPKDFLLHYGAQIEIDIPLLKKEYQRVNALAPEQAMAEYTAKKNAPERTPNVAPGTVEKLISSMNTQGAWVEELSVPDYLDVIHNPRRNFQGISTATFIRNMSTLIDYLKKPMILP